MVLDNFKLILLLFSPVSAIVAKKKRRKEDKEKNLKIKVMGLGSWQ
jgi:hypothetical protein